MTEMVQRESVLADVSARVEARLKRRYAAERRFRAYGLAAILIALTFLATMFVSIIGQGYTAFQQAEVRLDVTFDAEALGITEISDESLMAANFPAVIRRSMEARFPAATSRAERKDLVGMVSSGADHDLRKMLRADPTLLGRTVTVWLPASSDVDMTLKGHVGRTENDRQLTERQVGFLGQLERDGAVELTFNKRLFTNGDSRQPEQAGVWGAIVGSVYSMLITLSLSFPLGIATAIYLEEFAPKNRWTDLIEVNINNLAAVPSIVFGLLGLAVFLQFFGLPRSAPLVGGLVLTLISLPTIIIASRAALKAVPPSIREAALGLGASKLQMVFHHVLPLAMPGILTGTIIGMAHAIGETAPLLMIGMVAFVADIPHTPFDPSSVLPVQIYLWADTPERGFVERTSAAIIILLGFLAVMNAAAIFLRKKFERRW